MKNLTRREAERYKRGYAILWAVILFLPMLIPFINKMLNSNIESKELLTDLLVPALAAGVLFLIELSYAFAKRNNENCDRMSNVLFAIALIVFLTAACIFIHECCVIGAFICVCLMFVGFGYLKWLTTDLLPYVTLPKGPIRATKPDTTAGN